MLASWTRRLRRRMRAWAWLMQPLLHRMQPLQFPMQAPLSKMQAPLPEMQAPLPEMQTQQSPRLMPLHLSWTGATQ